MNDIVNCFTDNDIQLVLYADDTNIFITVDSRHNVIEKANTLLKLKSIYVSNCHKSNTYQTHQ